MKHRVLPYALALALPVAGCASSAANTPPPATPTASQTSAVQSPPPGPPVVPPVAAPSPAPVAPPTPSPEPPPAPLTAGATDPRDAALSTYTHDMTQALVHAAEGQPVDPRWVAHHPDHEHHHIASLSPEGHAAMHLLGNTLDVIATEVELQAIAQPEPGHHHQLSAIAIVLPNGDVRWGTAAHRHDTSEQTQPTPFLDHTAPALANGIARVIEALRGSCQLPWLSDTEIQSLPAHIRTEVLPDAGATHAACARAAEVHGEWRPHVNEVRVFVRGNNHVGILRSAFDVENPEGPAASARLVLSPVHIEVLPEH